mmetsp:Transcript_9992/g.17997  ORF Transcript_9992/g.17997 Transcript_9992/m.17997 type:complete len:100 (-) Transcript_9992:181-480(-)|eukprot:CAMPEP_0182449384 /NCGR_PEP_ID=MMETSP1172-20130603/33947_1 /TAXON_ID=708627 /ORGANISM="Timspurckia oligopyrenoides, Strain CCMP3278" /LENGTH=99 /DNA_ID=CAMNT_0024646645 /DNA_START=71 /DNA_END=370 /DNA_ORIENTATION=-
MEDSWKQNFSENAREIVRAHIVQQFSEIFRSLNENQIVERAEMLEKTMFQWASSASDYLYQIRFSVEMLRIENTDADFESEDVDESWEKVEQHFLECSS